ncbi:uncharacterized protein LOC129949606 [Eupeodes corollae]|uniref:uncharacterized protein LOC129949606 n=1 Tax=Eupeodes corollae TaxID=290404 RepID=UPI002490605C|nr:uncharacterized protein LOC129949606 [Eupeodes corollae]
MSSLPEKSQPITAAITATSSIISSSSSTTTSSLTKPMMTKTFFFRSDSIKKIKCTAAYPFQVAGLKLSKSALIELLETNIKKARICTQKAMLNFYCMILKLLSTLFALWDEKVQKKAYFRQTTSTTTTAGTTMLDSESSTATKINNAKLTTNPNESPIQSYQSRISEKLIRIQMHKRRLSGNSLIPSSSSISSASLTPKSTSTSVSTPLSTTPSSSTNDLSRRQSFSSSSSTESLRLSRTHLYKSKLHEYCLVFCVHAGLVVMYSQVVILGIALNTTYIPSGLIFMLSTIGLIGYIFVKVSLMNQKSVSEKSSPRSSPQPEAKNTNNSRCDPIKDDFSPERQSRSKTKRIPKQIIEFKYKNLSKVELL